MAEFTAQEIDSFEGRFTDLLDLLRKLRDYDLTKIKQLLEALIRVQEAPTLEEKIVAAMEVLRILTEITSTDIDDKIFEVLNDLMTPEMVAVIAKLIRRFVPPLPPVVVGEGPFAAASVEDENAVMAKGIPWALVVKLVPVIVGVIDATIRASK